MKPTITLRQLHAIDREAMCHPGMTQDSEAVRRLVFEVLRLRGELKKLRESILEERREMFAARSHGGQP